MNQEVSGRKRCLHRATQSNVRQELVQSPQHPMPRDRKQTTRRVASPALPHVLWCALVSVCLGNLAGAQPASNIGEQARDDSSSALMALSRSVVRVISRGDRSSGVLINSTGLVLTVAHGLHADSGAVEVSLYDGTKLRAQIAAADRENDLALIQLTDNLSDPPDHGLGVSEKPLRLGQSVLAAGFPGREPSGLPPVFRIGRVLAVNDNAARTGCTLTAGDSGGPLFDVQGRLCGVHRQIGAAVSSNLHVTASPIRSFLERHGVRIPPADVNIDPPPLVETATRPDRLLRERYDEIAVSILLPVSSDDTEKTDAGRQVAAGTRISDQEVVTKLSLLANAPEVVCEFSDGSLMAADVVHSDPTLDLALVQLRAAVPLSPAIAMSDFGQIVCAGASEQIGIIARTHHREASLPFRLGATFEQQSPDRLVVNTVQPNTFAATCGLRTGDQLNQFAGVAVSDFPSLESALGRREPGDWVTIHVQRDGSANQMKGQLIHDPRNEFDKAEFLDGRAGRLSRRRSGFAGVLQHDLVISPQSCGGPLFNAEGQLVGVNIARRARESTLAIPVATVLRFAHTEE